MKTLTLILSLAALQPLAAQEGLSSSDREALLDRLEKIREAADSKVDARFRTALSAFKGAMNSPNAAFDLYLNCEEKVNFEEMNKKNAEFREWKRQNNERLSNTGFRLALQLQLRWFVLTLEAASEKPDHDNLAKQTGKIVELIVAEASKLSDFRDIVQQGVTSSVFARAYNISGVKVEDWPLAPAPVAAVYEQIILPRLRRAERIDSLKAAWAKRIRDEGALVNHWSRPSGEKEKSGAHSSDYEKFVSDTVPALEWSAELDLFKVGDEKGAAIRMLKHIEAHLTHESAPKWAEEFVALLKTKKSAENNP